MFIQELKKKLTYAIEPKHLKLATKASVNVTTSATETVLSSYSAPHLNGHDAIKLNYFFTITNASGANEAFTIKVNFGGANLTTSAITFNDATTSLVGVEVSIMRSGNDFLANVKISNGGTLISMDKVLTEAQLTGITISTTNTSVTAGVGVSGQGGFVNLDRF